MRRRRLLDSCLLATTLRYAPVKARPDIVPPGWIEPSTLDRVQKLLHERHAERVETPPKS